MPAGKDKPVIVPYREHVPPDTVACIFWLKNRRREEWRDKHEVDHSGSLQFKDLSLEEIRQRIAVEEFSAALKKGKGEANSRVERSLYHRPVGYSYDAVKIFMPAGKDRPVIVPYREHVPPDTVACIFWPKIVSARNGGTSRRSTTAVRCRSRTFRLRRFGKGLRRSSKNSGRSLI